MAKEEWEVLAKNRFVEYLASTRGQDWNVLAEDVVVDEATGRNFDYQLGFQGNRIALEIFRLIEDPTELATQKASRNVLRLIKDELIRSGVRDCVVRAPKILQVSRVHRRAYVKEIVSRLVGAIEKNPASVKIEVDGFTVHREPRLGTVDVQRRDKASFRRAVWERAQEALDQKLPTKNDQLSVVGHENVVLVVGSLVVGSGYLIADDDVCNFIERVKACRHWYLNTFRNIDKIYFERSPESFDLVFDRGA